MGGACSRTHPAHFSVVVVALIIAAACCFGLSSRSDLLLRLSCVSHCRCVCRCVCRCSCVCICSCSFCLSSRRDLLLSLPLLLLSPLPVSGQPPPKPCHFDRSCSQPHREQRSGETRFSTHTASQPKPCSCLFSLPLQ